MPQVHRPTLPAGLVVGGHVLDKIDAAEVLAEIAELPTQLQAAQRHVARVEGGVHIRSDVPVVGLDHRDAGAVGDRQARGQKAAFAHILERKGELGVVEEGHFAPRQQPHVFRHPFVGAFVDVHLIGFHQPVGVVEIAGGVFDITFAAVASGPVEHEPFCGASSLHRADAVGRVVKVAGLAILVVDETRAGDFAVLVAFDDVALATGLVVGEVPTYGVAKQLVPALANIGLAFCDHALVEGPIDGIGFDLGVPVAQRDGCWRCDGSAARSGYHTLNGQGL